MKYCTNCLAEMKDDALFCPKCGTKQEEVKGLQSVLAGKYLIGQVEKQAYAYIRYKGRDLRTEEEVIIFEDTRTINEGVDEKEACRYFETDLMRSLSRDESGFSYSVKDAFCENDKVYLAAEKTDKPEKTKEEVGPENPVKPEQPAKDAVREQTENESSGQTNRPWLKPLAIAAAAVVVIAIIIASVNGRGEKTGTGGSSSAGTKVEETSSRSASGTVSGNVLGVIQDGVLASGFRTDNGSYSTLTSGGDFTGLDVELSRCICEILGWAYSDVPVENWDFKEETLYSGEADCIWNVNLPSESTDDYTITFDEGLACTRAYLDFSQDIVLLNDWGFSSLNEIIDAGLTIGVKIDSIAYNMFTNSESGNYNLKDYGSYEEAILALTLGDVDAVVMEKFWVGVYSEQMGISPITLDDHIGGRSGISLLPEEMDIAYQIDDALNILLEDPYVYDLAVQNDVPVYYVAGFYEYLLPVYNNDYNYVANYYGLWQYNG